MTHAKLFAAVTQPGDTPESLVERLTVEGLQGHPAETELRNEVTAFRHLRYDARLTAATRYLNQPAFEMQELAKMFVETSEDRRTNYLVVDDVRLPLGRHEHIIDAKAEFADLLWALQKILAAGKKA